MIDEKTLPDYIEAAMLDAISTKCPEEFRVAITAEMPAVLAMFASFATSTPAETVNRLMAIVDRLGEQVGACPPETLADFANKLVSVGAYMSKVGSSLKQVAEART